MDMAFESYLNWPGNLTNDWGDACINVLGNTSVSLIQPQQSELILMALVKSLENVFIFGH